MPTTAVRIGYLAVLVAALVVGVTNDPAPVVAVLVVGVGLGLQVVLAAARRRSRRTAPATGVPATA